ncbi:pentapeptide repeat-containing protein [Amycolatopsis rhabdoformis]|uniref:Pentapeptide repeat-containing protein n=1 Tax=Amycolatopsis rhabdoformis TaxID=1448059 RepID=A0ABZ1IBY0_9PSEU|nr:pentapeptide repeat-containing protein [Amycolatopsis rhabdoformis]WSE31458.1 pentapeptide repeat-containing protein [Amycolatopsis rhabdoformis]
MAEIPSPAPDPGEGTGSRPGRTLSNRTIAVCGAVMLAVAVAACWILLTLYGHGTDADRARLDGIRTVGTIVVGTGGALALVLAARRQQTAEHDLATKRAELRLREQADRAARHDATERRINELYLKAVEQLGSDKAPVRLAGLYALDRLAQDNAHLRQTIADVISAYLRMPYDLPGPERDADRDQLQEREVRLTAQRLLVRHLAPGDEDDRFWTGIEVDLSGAVLIDFPLNGCELHNARFTGTRFTGAAWFHEVRFTGATLFDGAVFGGEAWFTRATFKGNARFENSEFRGAARFEDTEFVGTTAFRGARFGHDARFDQALFRGVVRFSGATFARSADFKHAGFMVASVFDDDVASQSAYFDRARFGERAWFEGVSFASYTTFEAATFDGDIGFEEATLDGMPYRPPQLQSDSTAFDDGS